MIRQKTPMHSSTFSRRLRSTTFLRIRWLASCCQLVVVSFVAFYLQFSLPVMPCLALILISALVNIALSLYYPANYRLDPRAATLILAFDICVLTALVYLTGGLQNPFALLIIAPAIVSATSLHLHYIIILNILVIGAVTLLSYTYLPLPWYAGQFVAYPRLLIDGIWAAIVCLLIFTSAYAYQITEETRKLADALTATEFIIQREQHLSALDGLAAAAAHELGTPLATIQLISKELQIGLGEDESYREDLNLLKSQSDRCRDILKRLTSLSTQNDSVLSSFKLTTLLEEVIAPHRDFDIHIQTIGLEAIGDEPVFARNETIVYGLGNLIENAVDFARHNVTVEFGWNDKKITIKIIDDGDGYPVNILERIGEPYTTSRKSDGHGGGLGLGLFIAKTMLERSGAKIAFKNSLDDRLGAEVTLEWERHQLS